MAKEKATSTLRLLEGLQEDIEALETSAAKFDGGIYAHGPAVRKGLQAVKIRAQEIRLEVLARMHKILEERGQKAPAKKTPPKKKAAPKKPAAKKKATSKKKK